MFCALLALSFGTPDAAAADVAKIKNIRIRDTRPAFHQHRAPLRRGPVARRDRLGGLDPRRPLPRVGHHRGAGRGDVGRAGAQLPGDRTRAGGVRRQPGGRGFLHRAGRRVPRRAQHHPGLRHGLPDLRRARPGRKRRLGPRSDAVGARAGRARDTARRVGRAARGRGSHRTQLHARLRRHVRGHVRHRRTS